MLTSVNGKIKASVDKQFTQSAARTRARVLVAELIRNGTPKALYVQDHILAVRFKYQNTVVVTRVKPSQSCDDASAELRCRLVVSARHPEKALPPEHVCLLPYKTFACKKNAENVTVLRILPKYKMSPQFSCCTKKIAVLRSAWSLQCVYS